MFKEITGLAIGKYYIERHLSRYSKRDYFDHYNPSKDVIDFLKAGGDYREFLKNHQRIKYHEYLKNSKSSRD